MRPSIFLLGFIVAGSVVVADSLPALKEGLWSITTQTIVNPGGGKVESVSSLCRDHALDAKVEAHAKSGRKDCTVSKDAVEGGLHTVLTHCEVSGHTIEIASSTTPGGDSALHSETHVTYKPALNGRDDTTVIVDQKYTGACPAGMEPGDRMDKDGKVIHAAKSAK